MSNICSQTSDKKSRSLGKNTSAGIDPLGEHTQEIHNDIHNTTLIRTFQPQQHRHHASQNRDKAC